MPYRDIADCLKKNLLNIFTESTMFWVQRMCSKKKLEKLVGNLTYAA